MNVDRLRDLMRASPFVPFSLLFPNGEKVRIPHQDYIWIHPDRRTVIVVGEDGRTRLLSHQMLLGVELEGAAP